MPQQPRSIVTKSTTSDLPQAFHLTTGIATLHDLHNHSTPFIVVNISDEPLSLPPKTTVAHLKFLDGANVIISNFSDARDDVIPQAQHVAPPAPIPPADTSTPTHVAPPALIPPTAMHSPVANSQEPTPPPLLSNWQPLFDDLEINANPHLTESQKAELKNLDIEYSDIFQPSTAGLQQTDYVHHHIDTGNAKPSNSPPYRISPTKRQIISDQIDSMLHNDIISPSQSPWASPVILVEKKMKIISKDRIRRKIQLTKSGHIPRTLCQSLSDM